VPIIRLAAPRCFADTFVPVIEQAGGEIRHKAKVRELLVENAAVVGVRLEDGGQILAPHVFSDAGARNTVELLPADLRNSEWAREILSFAPSVCHVGLYLGTRRRHSCQRRLDVKPLVPRDLGHQ
jgi:all-trans-retinol 13,14-reductase